MLSLLGRKNTKLYREKTLAEVKDSARILVIDDRRPQLVGDLEREGWRVKYISDLDSYQNTDLIDSTVICLDILGVGEKLRCESGLDLVAGIKGHYLEKKILLYSSVQSHNIFSDAIDLVDRRIFKDGQPYQFIKSVEELAFQALDWNHCSRSIYEKFKGDFGAQITFDEFDKKLRACVAPDGSVDIEKLAKNTITGLKVAGAIAKFLQVVFK